MTEWVAGIILVVPLPYAVSTEVSNMVKKTLFIAPILVMALSSSWANEDIGTLGYNIVQTPETDDFSQPAVYTLQDRLKDEGSFARGAALVTIGRSDLAGLNVPINSFDTGSLETPVGGLFQQNTIEEPAPFGSRTRAARSN